MNTLKLLSAALPALLLMPLSATAQTIDLSTLYGVWDVQDQFSAPGDFYDHDYFASVATTVKFTDLFVVGDEYNIFINGVLFASALSPTDDGSYITDPDLAYASGSYTRGLIYLAAGDTLSFQIMTIPAGFNDGTLAVTAITAVPEPAAWGMMIGGFGLAGLALRRRTKISVRYAVLSKLSVSLTIGSAG